MAFLSWLAGEDSLTSAALTVRAQTISPNDVGRLYWPAFFPRVNVNSTRINDIVTIDFRPVADRREWNKRGRQVHLKTPDTRLAEMIPIESYFKVEEQEIQRLVEQTMGNEALFRSVIGARIPERTDSLVGANWRRLEIDAMSAWATGSIVVRDPQGAAADKTVSLGFAAARYLNTAAWTALGADHYARFIAFMEDAIDMIGPVEGAVMRLGTFKAIQAAAPQGIMAVPLTRQQVQDRVSQDLGMPFSFMVIEDSHDVYTDGGLAVTRTKVWADQQVAAVPAGLQTGRTYFAPVARAYEILASAPDSGIDLNGNTVYREVANGAREATIECQVNALTIPDEQKVYVIDAGV